ncbi:Lnb N-terminal periplasmic domain-containing protein [Halomonas sp. 328]|uniref:Lnb N-terminal periplasmic domain-containing protein n=1 Tax=Halomonas sp. 328 TaxID=2776704 RepID=UPI0018A70BDF|nr:DUF4105 domain-containing protein [Halomonas sp. 328]MBF8224026.1 DUF4105 domain-containing protein [Halomonas sp. 328]
MKKVTIMVLSVCVSLLILLGTLWGSLALAYQWPLPGPRLAAVAWCLVGLGALWWLWHGGPRWGWAGYGLLWVLLLGWWLSLAPSNDRDWAPDVAQMLSGEVDGDRLILHQVRDFRWQDREAGEPRWESREYDLSRLASVDLLIANWGLPLISHVMVTFGFDDGDFLTFSVEIRRERHEAFSSLAGFFKQYELSIVAAAERDLVGVRTNHRGERVSLYRIEMSPRARRDLLLSYVAEANALHETPRFYHTITANCTTIVYAMMRRIVDGLPMDYRLLLTGRLADYVHAVAGLMPGYSLAELKARADITEAARAAGDGPDFSRRIRQGVPGWE